MRRFEGKQSRFRPGRRATTADPARPLTINPGRRHVARAGLGCVLAVSTALTVGATVPAAAAPTVTGVKVSGTAQFKANGQTVGLSLDASSTNAGTGTGASGSCQSTGSGYVAQCVSITSVTRGSGAAADTATVTGTAQTPGQRQPVAIRIVVTDNANPNGAGSDTVALTLNGKTASGTVSNGNLTVTSTTPNHPPVAKPEGYYTGGTSVGDSAPGVLKNDEDPDGDPLTAVLVTPPAEGNLVFNPDGSFTYTYTGAPNRPVNGSFTYSAFDGMAYSDPVEVQVVVQSQK